MSDKEDGKTHKGYPFFWGKKTDSKTPKKFGEWNVLVESDLDSIDVKKEADQNTTYTLQQLYEFYKNGNALSPYYLNHHRRKDKSLARAQAHP